MANQRNYLAVLFVLGTGVFITASAEQPAPERQESLTAQSLPENKPSNSKSHPLSRVIELATRELNRADEEIDAYSCLLIKRERVDGEMTARQYMQAKIRHRKLRDGKIVTPLSVYLKFLKPSAVEGREVLYVEDQRDGDLLARRGGPRLANITVELDPKGHWAMQDNLHPITEIGFRNLGFKLIENMQADLAYDDVQVKYFDKAKLGDRPCQHIQVTHPNKAEHFDYHIARIFIDKELRVPVYFASYDFPKTKGDEPELKEEYIFTNMNLNPGFTDLDFDAKNPAYAFEVPQSTEQIAQIKP